MTIKPHTPQQLKIAHAFYEAQNLKLDQETGEVKNKMGVIVGHHKTAEFFWVGLTCEVEIDFIPNSAVCFHVLDKLIYKMHRNIH